MFQAPPLANIQHLSETKEDTRIIGMGVRMARHNDFTPPNIQHCSKTTAPEDNQNGIQYSWTRHFNMLILLDDTSSSILDNIKCQENMAQTNINILHIDTHTSMSSNLAIVDHVHCYDESGGSVIMQEH